MGNSGFFHLNPPELKMVDEMKGGVTMLHMSEDDDAQLSR